MSISAQTNWLKINPRPTARDLYGITTGGGKYLAVGQYGATIISANATEWQVGKPLARGQLNGAAYGKDLFVAIGESDLQYSYDGIEWYRAQTNTSSLNDIVFANGLFVAAGERGRIYTSENGSTWDLRYDTNAPYLRSVVYGGGQFVVVGDSGTVITSTDGISWSRKSIGSFASLCSIAYGNKTYVVMGDSRGAYVSNDAQSWTWVPDAFALSVKTIVYGNSTFAVLGYSDTVYTSEDGLAWQSTEIGFEECYFTDAIFDGHQFVACGLSGCRATSLDGINWQKNGSFTTENIGGIAYGNNTFVLAGDNIHTSTDAIRWTKRYTPTDGLRSIAFGNDRFVAVGYHGSIVTSADAVSWKVAFKRDYSIQFDKVIFFNDQFLVASLGTSASQYSRAMILASRDGSQWDTVMVKDTPSGMYNLVQGNGVCIATGQDYDPDGNFVMTSTDGLTWNRQPSPSNKLWLNIIFNKGKFYEHTSSGTVKSSIDGTSWSDPESLNISIETIFTANDHLYGITGYPKKFYHSMDGKMWTQSSIEIEENIRDVFYAQDTYLAVGGQGAIYLSNSQITSNGQERPVKAPKTAPTVSILQKANRVLLSVPGQTHISAKDIRIVSALGRIVPISKIETRGEQITITTEKTMVQGIYFVFVKSRYAGRFSALQQ